MLATIIDSFDAAHKLYMGAKTEMENKHIYGRCCDLHGHTYKLKVTIEGSVQEDGMIVNFKEIKSITKSVTGILDHGFLNDYIKLPTAENIIKYLWEQLEPAFRVKSLTLYELVLFENEDLYITMHNQ